MVLPFCSTYKDILQNSTSGIIEWGEEKDLSQIPIYGPNTTMPIAIEDMDVFAPYHVLASSSPLEEDGIYFTFDEGNWMIESVTESSPVYRRRMYYRA